MIITVESVRIWTVVHSFALMALGEKKNDRKYLDWTAACSHYTNLQLSYTQAWKLVIPVCNLTSSENKAKHPKWLHHHSERLTPSVRVQTYRFQVLVLGIASLLSTDDAVLLVSLMCDLEFALMQFVVLSTWDESEPMVHCCKTLLWVGCPLQAGTELQQQVKEFRDVLFISGVVGFSHEIDRRTDTASSVMWTLY